MATQFRRLNVTLDDQTDIALRRLSVLARKPQATLIREWLRQATPAFEDMVRAFELAKTAPIEAVALMVRQSDEAANELRQATMPFRRKPGRPRKRG